MDVRKARWLPLAIVVVSGCGGDDDYGFTGSAGTGSSSSEGGTPQGSTGDDPSGATEAAESSGEASPVDTSSASSEGGESPYACAEPPPCDPTPGVGPTRVELRVHGIDDVVVAEVNGLRRGFWSIPTLPSQDTGRIDVTGWFARGSNELRILAANTGGPARFGVQVWVDDAIVLDRTCAPEVCPTGVDVPLGYIHDESIAIDSEAFACPQQVCVHGEEEGSLYVDGVFTGARAPIELLLPPGGFEIGVGSGTDDPLPDTGAGFVHEGRFRRRDVVVADAAVEVELGDGDLASATTYDFLIVPIRNVQYPNGQLGVLADDVSTNLVAAVERSSATMAEPFSYGMASFVGDVHPPLETTVVADADGFVNIDMAALEAAGLDPAQVASHDVVVWTYSAHLADGSPVASQPCCAWGGGSQIWMHTGWVYEQPIVDYVLLHEWLHTTEDELITVGYGGADGVHGSEEHGYMSGSNGEYDFGQFYRHFMRGQLVEQGTHVGAVIDLYGATMASPVSSGGVYRALSVER